MANSIKKIALRADGPCPCGSGKASASCHLDFDGQFRKPRPSLFPPRPPTGFSHRHCYLRSTCDCSEQISREHYISRSVLEQLGAVIRVSGASWLSPGVKLDTTTASLTAKILCKRHNEALSPLDTEAGCFFSILTNVLTDLERKSLSRKPKFHLVCGEALELWMLKVACGLYFGIGTTDRVRLAETHTIDLHRVRRAFFEGEWDARAGLYFHGAIGSRITVAHNVAISPLTMDHDSRFSGAIVSLLGFQLELIFDEKNTHSGSWVGLVRRPTELVIEKDRRRHSIILTWPPGTPEASVHMSGRGRSLPARTAIKQ